MADFGLSRNFDRNKKNYTRGVVTIYYRPPEILMGMDYDHKSDLWSLGCIFAELLNFGKPILRGKNVDHQFELICGHIGFPTPEVWPEVYMERPNEIKRL